MKQKTTLAEFGGRRYHSTITDEFDIIYEIEGRCENPWLLVTIDASSYPDWHPNNPDCGRRRGQQICAKSGGQSTSFLPYLISDI